LLTIKHALLRKEHKFLFLENEIELKEFGFGLFATQRFLDIKNDPFPPNMKLLFRHTVMV